jgi:hypothetical protein
MAFGVVTEPAQSDEIYLSNMVICERVSKKQSYIFIATQFLKPTHVKLTLQKIW